MILKNRSVLLIVGGGIAAYKCLELIRLLKQQGCAVRAVMTRAAMEFVTPLAVASLTGETVHEALFDLTEEAEMGHIELSRSADLLVVAPATADLMAKMASGLANDLASTALLATDKPVLIAPAMNVRMWTHAATQRNLERLRGDGIHVVGPNEGDMACGEYGPGRMAEPAEILGAIETRLSSPSGVLTGRKVVITAGPTHEPIDPVRYLGNRSSGKQGYAIAGAALALGAETVLVSGPVDLPPPPGALVMPVETARQMLEACQAEMPCDIAIFAAAVADWRVAEPQDDKIKKTRAGVPRLELVENPDVLRTIAGSRDRRPKLVVGFAAETRDIIDNAKAKLDSKGCDVIVANDVSRDMGVMGGNRNSVHLVTRDGVETWPDMSKDQVARRLMETLARRLA